MAFTDCEASHYHVPYVILKDFEDGLPLLTSYPSLLQGCVANATTVTGGDEDLSKVTMASSSAASGGRREGWRT